MDNNSKIKLSPLTYKNQRYRLKHFIFILMYAIISIITPEFSTQTI